MYLDHAATTPMRPEAMEAVRRAWDEASGNASGTHAVARSAKNALEQAREEAAELLGADRPDEVVFTSGGTESDNLAIVGASLAHAENAVTVSSIEHKAVLESAASLGRFGYSVHLAPCDERAVVAPDHVVDATPAGTAVVSVMRANNEVGTMQPVAEIAGAIRTHRPDVLVHTDAVQSFVAEDVRPITASVDLLSLAAHKIGGPKGVGLLFVRAGTRLDPIIHGGGHEAGRRSGTSNVAGAVGMVAAMRAASRDRDQFNEVVGRERDRFEAALSARVGATVNGEGADRLAHFSHVRIPGVDAETLLIRLDQEGVHAAAGSSCQSGAIEPSHVLMAMGMPVDEASECVRFSFGWDTAAGDGQRAADAVVEVVEAMA